MFSLYHARNMMSMSSFSSTKLKTGGGLPYQSDGGKLFFTALKEVPKSAD